MWWWWLCVCEVCVVGCVVLWGVRGLVWICMVVMSSVRIIM